MLKKLAKIGAIRAGLEASALIARSGILRTARGRGAIFTLHRVKPATASLFNTNGHLEVTPQFLDAAITQLKRDGYRLVALDAVPSLLAEKDETAAPFAAFTLDDGFRDNRDHALPVFERHGAPFTIFVCRGFSERTHGLWWETANRLLNGSQPIEIDGADGARLTLPLNTAAERQAACDRLCPQIAGPDEAGNIARLDDAARRAGVDPLTLAAELVMDGEELSALARHPLASLGAHTVSHRGLSFLPPDELARELSLSADYVSRLTGQPTRLFAYPYGDARSVSRETQAAVAEAGFSLAVTTRPGTLSPTMAASPFALPRISLNGFYQKPRYVSALASGLPFRISGAG